MLYIPWRHELEDTKGFEVVSDRDALWTIGVFVSKPYRSDQDTEIVDLAISGRAELVAVDTSVLPVDLIDEIRKTDGHVYAKVSVQNERAIEVNEMGLAIWTLNSESSHS